MQFIIKDYGSLCYLSIGSNCPLCAKKIYLASISTIFRLDFGYNNMFFVVHVFQYKRVHTTGVTSGAGTAYPSGAPDFTSGF
jgi:hypothetical protein